MCETVTLVIEKTTHRIIEKKTYKFQIVCENILLGELWCSFITDLPQGFISSPTTSTFNCTCTVNCLWKRKYGSRLLQLIYFIQGFIISTQYRNNATLLAEVYIIKVVTPTFLNRLNLQELRNIYLRFKLHKAYKMSSIKDNNKTHPWMRCTYTNMLHG